MLTTARWRVNRGKEKNLCCSCERLLVGGNIGAKLEGWRHFDGDKERIDGDQRSGGGRSAFETGNGTAAGGRGSVDASEQKKGFLDALAAFEGESQKRFAKDFPALEVSQKSQLLTDASATATKQNSDGEVAGESSAGLHKHFENLKSWVSGAYYSS